MVEWIEGQPSAGGLYWVHDSLNGVLFAMVVELDEAEAKGLYYYIMGCDMGFPVEQLTHYHRVLPPSPPKGVLRVLPPEDEE